MRLSWLGHLDRHVRTAAHPLVASRRGAVVICASAVSWIDHALGDPDPVETMDRVARDLDLQTRMPIDEPPPDIHWSHFRWHIPSSVATLILYAALAVGFVFVVLALRGNRPGLSPRGKLSRGDSAIVLPNEEALERMNEAGDDAEALARRGLFAEAMHMLLLRSVGELRKGLDVTIADSLTSREILQRLSLPEAGRRALADLIARVELVHFGRRAAARDDYGACRASFEVLIGAMCISAARA